MLRHRLIENRLKILVGTVIAVMVMAQIVVWRALFADGAFLLMRVLSTRQFHDTNEPSRVFDYWFTQFPTVFAIKLGVTNMHFLTYLFTSWMILCFMIFWGGALWLVRRDFLFWPFTALFIVAYFNGGFFTVGEYNLNYALTAFSFAVLLRRRANTPMIHVALIGAAVLSMLTYASTLFLGPVLAYATWHRLRCEANRPMKAYWMTLIAIFLISSAIGLWAYLYPNHPLNKARAASFGVLAYDLQFWIISIFAALLTLQLVLPRGAREAVFIGLLGIATVLLTGLFLPHPSLDFAIRVYTGLVLCAGFAGLSWFRFGGYRLIWRGGRGLHDFDPVKYYAVPVCTLLAVLSFFDIGRSKDFGPYLNTFRAQVNTHTGLLAWETTMAPVPNDMIFGWAWTYPSMSLLLRRDAEAAIVRNAERNTEEQPFDPQSPPDMSRYYARR